MQYLHRCLKTKDPLFHLGNEWRHTFQTFQTFHRDWKLLQNRPFASTPLNPLICQWNNFYIKSKKLTIQATQSTPYRGDFGFLWHLIISNTLIWKFLIRLDSIFINNFTLARISYWAVLTRLFIHNFHSYDSMTKCSSTQSFGGSKNLLLWEGLVSLP